MDPSTDYSKKRQKEFSGPTIKKGDIEFIRMIGKGSSGNVWESLVYGHLVAVKELRNPDEEQKKHFKTEAKLMSTINHPNICMFLGVCEDGGLFIVTELAHRSLDTIIASTDYSFTYLYFDRLEILRQICVGMAWLHECKVVHCDLKPANVLVGRDNYYKVTDFGYAQFKPEYKLENAVGGSPLYMSPERLLDYQKVTKETDVYSFAISAWEIVTGKRPFANHNNKQVFTRAVNDQHERPSPAVQDPVLQDLLNAAWDHDPEKRPDFRAIQTELIKIKVDESIHDPHGREFWKKNFSEGKHITEKVNWDQFMKAFCNETNCNDGDTIKKLQELLCSNKNDNSKDNNGVTISKFGTVCDTFSLMKPEGTKILKSVLEKRWFYSFINENEANEYLQNHDPDTFLVRFSSSGHQFVISRVVGTDDDGKKNIVHIRVEKTPEGQFRLPSEIQSYKNIEDLVKNQKSKLKVPCPRFNQGGGGLRVSTEYASELQSTEGYSNVFQLSSYLSGLSGATKPEEVLQNLKKARDYLLKDCEKESATDDITLWLGQTLKYISLLELYIKNVTEGTGKVIHPIQDLIDSKIDADVLV